MACRRFAFQQGLQRNKAAIKYINAQQALNAANFFQAINGVTWKSLLNCENRFDSNT